MLLLCLIVVFIVCYASAIVAVFVAVYGLLRSVVELFCEG